MNDDDFYEKYSHEQLELMESLCFVCNQRISSTVPLIEQHEEVGGGYRPLSKDLCPMCCGMFDPHLFRSISARVAVLLEDFCMKSFDTLVIHLSLPIELKTREIEKLEKLEKTFHSYINVQSGFKTLLFRTLRDVDLKDLAITPILKDNDDGNHLVVNVTMEFEDHTYSRKGVRFPFKKRLPVRVICRSLEIISPTVYLSGRYKKFSRRTPQSHWAAHSDNFMHSSIAEQIGDTLLPSFNHVPGHEEYREMIEGPKQPILKRSPSTVVFSASGREDLDVRCLGRGRPFLIKIACPRVLPWLFLDEESSKWCKNFEILFNKSTSDLSIGNFDAAPLNIQRSILLGQEEKRKAYRCVVWSSKPIPSVSELQSKFSSLVCPIKLAQQTPVRVIHRRPNMVRPRSIYSLSVSFITPHSFLLDLETQAGLYVKEFVHGDLGRTRPSVSELLGVGVDVRIVQLDVRDVIF